VLNVQTEFAMQLLAQAHVQLALALPARQIAPPVVPRTRQVSCLKTATPLAALPEEGLSGDNLPAGQPGFIRAALLAILQILLDSPW